MNKTCELCNKTFTCTVNELCWCMKVVPLRIEETYNDCICDECLYSIEKKTIKND